MKIKKFITAATALSMSVLLATNNIYAVKFPDLAGYGWAEPSITSLVNKGVIGGRPDGTFRPGMPISRLESLIMISKLFPDEEVDRIYKQNLAKYDAKLTKYGVEDWAKKPVVYALEKGIIPNKDAMLEGFIDQKRFKEKKQRVQISALRFEVCVFLVRGLGMEGQINKNAKLSYKDANKILGQAVPYIELLQRKGILSKDGDGTGNFNPENTIKRAEAAVMFANAYKYSGKAKQESNQQNTNVQPQQPETPDQNAAVDNTRKIIKGKVNLLTYADNKVTVAVTTEDGSIKSYTNEKNNISVKIGDKITSVNAIQIGQEASFDVEGVKLNQIMLTPQEEKYKGTLKGYSSDTNTIDVSVPDGDIYANKKFKVNKDTRIYVNDKLTEVDKIPVDNDIEFTVQDGVVVKGSMTVTREKIDGEIKNYTSTSITVDSAKKGEVTRKLAKNVKIYRNEKIVDDINSLAIGDQAFLDIDNDLVKEIDVTAKKKRYLSAIIREIQLTSRFNRLTIQDTDGEVHNLTATPDTLIRIDGKKASVYDLKIGYKVDVYAEGGLVDEIDSKGEYKTVSMSGVVVDTDTIDKMIEIKKDNGKTAKFYYDVNTNAEKLKNGLKINPKDIQKGDELTVIGIETSGTVKAERIIANF